MNVTKILIILILIPFLGFAQKQDVYFILEKNNPEYVFSPKIKEFKSKVNSFSLSVRHEFEKWEKKYKKEKEKNPDIDILYAKGGKPYLFSLDFNVLLKKTKEITKCEMKELRIVDFEWLIYNSWKENNKNILFRDLYFLFKIENEKYISYKVGRTIIMR